MSTPISVQGYKKLEDEQHTYITNVYGMGYLWK